MMSSLNLACHGFRCMKNVGYKQNITYICAHMDYKIQQYCLRYSSIGIIIYSVSI